ncbi:MAG: ABC transporter substrate-binding protein [Sphaerochaetaceae bacterium]|nr:ABC transporter substrate-binding protein [Sphaerochaetaceae bacterium]
MKKFYLISVILIALLVLCGCSKSSAGSYTVKIGVFEPQSGDNGAGGKQEVIGIQYANSIRPTVKIAGKEYKVVLDIQDNQSSTDKAVSAAQQLVADKCSIVLGSYGSGVSIAAGSYFKDAKIPAIGVSCTNAAVTAGNDYYFRVCFLDPFQGSVMANFAREECKAEKAYVLSMLGDDYTVGLAKNFVSSFKALGGTVVADETFVEGTSDFSSYLQNAKDFGADVIFAPSATTYAALIIEQASTKGLSIPILAGDTWESSVISDAQNGKNIKVYCSTFFDENDKSGIASQFVNGFKSYLNSNATAKTNNGGNDIVAAVSALGFDAYNLACDVIEKAGSTDGKVLRDALAAYSGDSFVTGAISFDANGDAKKNTAYIKQAVNGAFSFVKVQSAR